MRLKSLRTRHAAIAAVLLCGAGIAVGAKMGEARTTHGEVDLASIPVPQRVFARSGPVKESRTRIVKLTNAPFPYEGLVPRTSRPFLDVVENGRRGHRNHRGGVYWEDEKYNDSRVLLHIPKGFDVRRPGLVVVYFHGHGAKLEQDVWRRQQIPAQISSSAANAVLIAPQFAVDAADSSAGKLWEPGGFDRFLREAAGELARLHGDPRSAIAFANMPVVIVAYSGGYLPAAWCVQRGGIGKRLRGVVLLDALYGELDTFASWIEKDRLSFFVSAYLDSTRNKNATLQRILSDRALDINTELEPRLRKGSVTILPGGSDVTHRDLLTRAWVDHPLEDLLGRLAEYKR
jgi:hypothetical protein